MTLEGNGRAPGAVGAWATAGLPEGHVLTVGCGSGAAAIALARAGREVSATDPRPELVQAARDALVDEDDDVRARARFLVTEGPLPFPTAAFDCALVEELDRSPAGVRATLDEVRRVLRPGAVLLVWLPPNAPQEIAEWAAESFAVEGSEAVAAGIGLRLRAGARGAAREGEPADVRALLAALGEDQRRIERLEADRARADAELSAARDRLAELEDRVFDAEALSAEVARLRTSVREAEAEADRARAALAARTTAATRFEATAAADRARLEAAVERLERDLRRSRGEVASRKAEARTKEQRLRETIAKERRKVERRDSELAAIRSSRWFRLGRLVRRAGGWVLRPLRRRSSAAVDQER